MDKQRWTDLQAESRQVVFVWQTGVKMRMPLLKGMSRKKDVFSNDITPCKRGGRYKNVGSSN